MDGRGITRQPVRSEPWYGVPDLGGAHLPRDRRCAGGRGAISARNTRASLTRLGERSHKQERCRQEETETVPLTTTLPKALPRKGNAPRSVSRADADRSSYRARRSGRT